MKILWSVLSGVSVLGVCCVFGEQANPKGNAGEGTAALPPATAVVPVGGANSPKPTPPPGFVIETTELQVGAFAVKVPTGTYKAPAEGAPNYRVPGPIAAFKGPDGVWRGHGYLETLVKLLSFEGKKEGTGILLNYAFEGGKFYKVKLEPRDGALLIEESADLGPRNCYVLDCYYQWEASSGFALDMDGKNHAFLYLPCYYDKPEVNVLVSRAASPSNTPPGAVAVLSPDAATKDVAGFFVRQKDQWENPEAMGMQLWQHRQRPGDLSSRHFLGPETKSDSTPNPRTAALLGTSLYEGHVTIELAIGQGKRLLGFAVATKGSEKSKAADAFKAAMQAHVR